MRWSALAKFGILISALAACSRPVMAQHQRGSPHAATGGQAQHHANGGGGPSAAQMRQMQQQQQQMMRQQQQQMQKMQQEAHRQYQQEVQRFEQWRKANGGKGATGRLPNNPAEFQQWAATQKQRKAQGKSYDQMYDQYRSFAGSRTPSKSGQGKSGQAQAQVAKSQSGQSQSGQSASTAHASRGNHSQAATAGSTSSGSTTTQQAKNSSSNQAAGSSAGQEKHGEHGREERRLAEFRHEERRLAELHEERRLAELHHEEHRLAELRREERTLMANRLARGVLAQDQTKVSLLRLVHSRLVQADHDYNGHRMQAMNSVSHALNLLGSPTPPGGGVALGNTPQAQSNGILRDSISKLRIVHSQLGATASNPGHHALARTSVGHAISQLEAGLAAR
jgi:hypothetical protein